MKNGITLKKVIKYSLVCIIYLVTYIIVVTVLNNFNFSKSVVMQAIISGIFTIVIVGVINKFFKKSK